MINGVTMKICVDDYILRTLKEDINDEDVSTNAVMPVNKQGSAQLIRLVPQVARRCLMSRSAQIEILDTTSKCGQYLLPYFHGESEEVVYLLCLDAKCKALDCVLIHRGGVNVASIAARKVVKAALDANATSVVLAHNHPSGLALPSPEDRQTTLVLKAALEAVGIVLADHIIVADDDFVSLRDDGILEDPYEL